MTLTLTLTCTLISVTDGDTLRAACPQPESIRIANIDAPDHKTCPRDAQAATEALRGMATPRLQVEALYRDRYGRIVGIVTNAQGADLGTQMVGGGWAQPWPHSKTGHALTPRPRGC